MKFKALVLSIASFFSFMYVYEAIFWQGIPPKQKLLDKQYLEKLDTYVYMIENGRFDFMGVPQYYTYILFSKGEDLDTETIFHNFDDYPCFIRISNDEDGKARILVSPHDPYCFYISNVSETLYQRAHGKKSKIENKTYSVKYIHYETFIDAYKDRGYTIPEELISNGYLELMPKEGIYDKILILKDVEGKLR